MTYYVATNVQSGERRLVEATNRAQVARHIIANDYMIEPANPHDLYHLAAQGVTLEQVDPRDKVPNVAEHNADAAELLK